jgi:hypothetical protein
MRSFVASLVALSLAGAACAPPERTTAARAEVDAERWAQLVEHLADAVAADAASCPRMVDDVATILCANRPLVDAGNAALGDGFTLPDDAHKRIAAAVARMLPGIDACGAEGAVQKAFSLAKGSDAGSDTIKQLCAAPPGVRGTPAS